MLERQIEEMINIMPLKPVNYKHRNQNQLSVFACTVCNDFVEKKRDFILTVIAWIRGMYVNAGRG